MSPHCGGHQGCVREAATFPTVERVRERGVLVRRASARVLPQDDTDL